MWGHPFVQGVNAIVITLVRGWFQGNSCVACTNNAKTMNLFMNCHSYKSKAYSDWNVISGNDNEKQIAAGIAIERKLVAFFVPAVYIVFSQWQDKREPNTCDKVRFQILCYNDLPTSCRDFRYSVGLIQNSQMPNKLVNEHSWKQRDSF